jgi:hypothetical protein
MLFTEVFNEYVTLEILTFTTKIVLLFFNLYSISSILNHCLINLQKIYKFKKSMDLWEKRRKWDACDMMTTWYNLPNIITLKTNHLRESLTVKVQKYFFSPCPQFLQPLTLWMLGTLSSVVEAAEWHDYPYSLAANLNLTAISSYSLCMVRHPTTNSFS